MQTHKLPPVMVNIDQGGTFVPINVQFTFSFDLKTVLSTNENEADDFRNRVTRVFSFLEGLHNSYVLETTYPNLEMFITGKLRHITVEVPNGWDTMPFFGILMYRKVQALMNDFVVSTFSIDFNVHHQSTKNSSTMITYTPSDVESGVLHEVLIENEKLWVEMLKEDVDNSEIDDFNSIEDIDAYISNPWWGRDNGDVRDFVDVDESVLANLDEEPIQILSIDLGDGYEELERELMESLVEKGMVEIDDDIDLSDDDDDDPKPTSPPTDDYYKV